MRKAIRGAVLLLLTTLLCGILICAAADVTTIGIYFCGRMPQADGTDLIIPLEGRFRVTQNGEEAGVIEAGKTVLTLPGTERIRIAPLPESIEPGWDLSTAYQEVAAEAGGTTTVSVVVVPLTAAKAAGTPSIPTPAPSGEEGGETGVPDQDTSDNGQGETWDDTAALPSGPVVTPTFPPFDASILAPTPEPDWKALEPGNGSVRVLAFYDQQNNGSYTDNEKGVSGIVICLLTVDGEAVTRAETGSDGFAEFIGLPAGSYRIKAILPDNWAFTKKSSVPEDPYGSVFPASGAGEAVSDPFDVTEGETATRGIALMKGLLHISGTCWFDSVTDGLWKEGEDVVPGVRIELDGEKNGLHFETISKEDGTWRIDRIPAASYRLTVYAPEGMMFARHSNVGGRRSIISRDGVSVASRLMDLNDKESKERQYLGFCWASKVTGLCFLDANYNGVYDEGELPMAGVKIAAQKTNEEHEQVAVTYSREDGTYELTGLRGNTYRMRVVLPEDGSDFSRVVSDPLGNHFQSRPGRRENFWNNFVLQDSEQREMNVGVIYPGTVMGTVYIDSDFSASLTGKEKIISGFLVKLLDQNGTIVAMDKADVKGRYVLEGIPPGTYSLSVSALKGYAFTKLGEGNVILNLTGGDGYSEPFFLSLGEKKTGMDIGMIQPGTVRGSVFADRNDNGVRDSDEAGLKGVTVRLMSGEGEAFHAVIGADGNYLFDAVMPGEYYLEYVLPENACFARVTNGGNTITGEGTGRSESFVMKTGDEHTGPVCGALTLGRIAGNAYMDHDGSGEAGSGEAPTEGLILTLTPTRADLEEMTVTTGPDGAFSLDAIHPDTYTLTVTCPEHHVLSRTDRISLPLAAGKQTQSVQLPVAMGAEWTGQQLGTVIPASLSGQLWLDENNNGMFDAGEQTPAGYEIAVTDNTTGNLFDLLVTDSEGRFATSGMIPGSFTLSFTLDADTIAPKPGNSNFQEENGKLVFPDIQLNESESRDGLLLGIVRYTSVGGTVWIDRGDHVDTLGGAAVTLKDEAGNSLRTVTTAENGVFRFDQLMPGTYSLEANMPEGCVIIEPGDPRLGGDQISVMTHTVNRNGSSDPFELKMAADRLQLNIGCVLPGKIGDYCWLDLNRDGLQGMGESGIPNVKIELLRDGVVLAETLTDQYGFYRFSDLYPAVYTLRVTAPAEVVPTKRRTDIRGIASVLEETEDTVCVTVEIRVESDKANLNADLGFVCRKDGVIPAGVGEGKKQDWTKIQ